MFELILRIFGLWQDLICFGLGICRTSGKLEVERPKGTLTKHKDSGGLAHRETGRFPGGPLLQEFLRAPGRRPTCEFISLIIS